MAYSPTAFQVSHLLQRTFRKLKGARTSVSTATGTATTLVDTRLVDILSDSNEDDYLNNWTLIITKDAGGAGASPEGKFNRISDYDDAGIKTVPDTLTDAPAAGDKYMYISPDFPLYDMLEVMNDALVSLGWVPVVNSSITTAAGQTEYALPLTVKGNDLLDVELQGILSDANDNRYTKVSDWQIVPAAGGSTGLLVIPQFAAGYLLRLTHLGLHPAVSLYDDYINEYIHPELAVAVFTAHALEWYNTQASGKDEFWLRREDRAWNQLDIAKAMFPIILPQRRFQNFPSFGRSELIDKFPPLTFS